MIIAFLLDRSAQLQQDKAIVLYHQKDIKNFLKKKPNQNPNQPIQKSNSPENYFLLGRSKPFLDGPPM